MNAARLVASSALAVIVSACGAPVVEPALSISPDRASFDGRVERVVVKIRAWEAGESPGGGVVHLTAPVGHFIGGDQEVLADGFVTATYACSPTEEAACLGPIRLSVEWSDLHATTLVVGVDPVAPVPVSWEVVPTMTSARLLALGAAPDGSAWAVGERGTVLHLVGRTWVNVSSGVVSTLRGVAFSATGAPVVVGDDGTVLEWSGERFMLTTVEGADFTAVAVDAHGALHLGSATGMLFDQRLGGFEPVLDLRTPVLSLARQDGELWATGDAVLAHFSAGQWLSVPLPAQGRFFFAQTGADGIWLGGERMGTGSSIGILVQGPSPGWRTTLLPEPVRAIAEVPGMAERFALSSAHLYRQLEGGKWDVVEVPSTAVALASRATGDLVLLGPPGISLLRK